MMKFYVWVFAVGFLMATLSTASASDFRVNGTTKMTYDSSLKVMFDSLPQADQEAFRKGLLNLIVTEYPPAKGVAKKRLLQFVTPALNVAPTTMHGKSLSEILNRGEKFLPNRKP